MKQTAQLYLEKIANLSPNERAAAIAHRIYVSTAERSHWATRVPEEWEELSDEVRAKFGIDQDMDRGAETVRFVAGGDERVAEVAIEQKALRIPRLLINQRQRCLPGIDPE